jgi:hypothetical protein
MASHFFVRFGSPKIPTTAQLVVDATRLVALGADDVQAAGRDHLVVARLPFAAHARGGDFVEARLARRPGGRFELGLEIAAELDVGAATSHVRGDGHLARHARVLDDVRLALVLLGVQHVVVDVMLAQHAGDQLGAFDRRGADQHRLAAFHAVLDVLDDGLVLVVLREIDEVRVILADHRLVGGDHDHFQAVDLHELRRLGVRRAGHARELLVDAEVVLEGDGRDGLVLRAHLHAFLGLDRLVQAIRPAPARHGAAGELVDDDHLARAHDVFHVAFIDRVGAQRRVQVVHQADVRRVVETLALAQQPGLEHQLLDLLLPGFRHVGLFLLLVDRVVAGTLLGLLLHQARHELVDLQVQLGVFFRRAGNDERRARLVDEDRVHFVDDGEGQLALHAVLQAERQVVTQVIEAEFVVGAVGDVAGVGGALFGVLLLVADHADGEPEEAVDGAHPVCVALRQVLVDGDHVDTLARQRVEISRERRHQRLALTGAHLGDAAVVQRESADQLHVEVAHLQRAERGFAHHGESFGSKVVEFLAVGEALAEFVGLGGEGRVAEGFQGGLEAGGLAHRRLITADDAIVATAEKSRQEIEHLKNPCQKIATRKLQCSQRLRSTRREAGPVFYG